MADASSTPWAELVEVARWAPSPHNTQPWKLEPVDARTARLHMVRSRRLPDEDTTGCFLLCAMGIFIEALSIAASHRGLALRTSVVPALDPSSELIEFATLTLHDGGSPGRFSPKDLLERRTCRLPPGPAPVPAASLPELRAIAAEGGHTLHDITDARVIGEVLDINADAVLHDLADPKYGGEIARWFRCTAAHSRRTRDGLDARCMNTPGHELWLSTRASWLLSSALVRPLVLRRYRRRVGPAAHLGLISGAFFEGHAAVGAGAMLLRLWLRLHQLGVHILPFGNLVTNPDAHERLIRATGLRGVWLVFRMGFTPPPPASLRLSTQEVLCSPR